MLAITPFMKSVSPCTLWEWPAWQASQSSWSSHILNVSCQNNQQRQRVFADKHSLLRTVFCTTGGCQLNLSLAEAIWESTDSITALYVGVYRKLARTLMFVWVTRIFESTSFSWNQGYANVQILNTIRTSFSAFVHEFSRKIAVKSRFYTWHAAAQQQLVKRPRKSKNRAFLVDHEGWVLQAGFLQYTGTRGEAHFEGQLPRWGSPLASV